MMPPTLALVLLLQAADGPVSVFVGPNVRDGFVDVDKGIQDAIQDLRQELNANPSLRLASDEQSARLKLYVAERRRFKTGDSVVTALGHTSGAAVGVSSATGVAVAVEGFRVEAILRVGDYEKKLVGESESRWKGCAKAIAEDIAVWVKANRDRLVGDSR